MTVVFLVLALFALVTLTEIQWGETPHGPYLVAALLVASLAIALWQLVTRL